MVTVLGLGMLAFLLFFLSDINDCLLRWRPLGLCFPLGVGMLGLATVWSCVGRTSLFSLPLRIVFMAVGAVFLILTVVALFFSLPSKEAYVTREEGRPATTGGFYALCRHPGVLFFIPMYFCISGAFGLPYVEAGIYSLLDVLLIVFEDIYVFPRVLSGYEDYRKRTPFLIPNKSGIVQCWRDLRDGWLAWRSKH